MENQNLVLMKLSKLLPSSLLSCKSQTVADIVADNSIPIPKPKKTRDPNEKQQQQQQQQQHSDPEGRKCPPVTPASATAAAKNQSSSSNSGRWFTSSDEMRTRTAESDTFCNSGDSVLCQRRAKNKCDEMMKSIDENGRCSFSSLASYNGKEEEAAGGSDLVATRLYYESGCRRRRNRRRSHRRCSSSEGFAVEKRSSDPYADFMASMVEMIIERQMFGAEDLDRLLFCFLSLNKADYHGIIFDVFAEICQTLFSD